MNPMDPWMDPNVIARAHEKARAGGMTRLPRLGEYSVLFPVSAADFASLLGLVDRGRGFLPK